MATAEASLAEAPTKSFRLAAKLKPWEPQENESAKAYQAFAAYRELGSSRSIEQVSQILSKSIPFLKQWSAKWAWVERAKAYDAYLIQLRTSAREQSLAKQARKIMSADEVKEGLTRIAEFDIAEVFEPDGSFDLAAAKSRGASRLIKSLSFDKDTRQVVKVECYSAHEGHRDMAKIHSLFVEKVEIEDKTQREPQQTLAELIFERTGERLTEDQAARIMAASVQRLAPVKVIDVTPDRIPLDNTDNGLTPVESASRKE